MTEPPEEIGEGPPRPIRVVIADDQVLIREAIRQRLEAAFDVELVGEAGSTEEALRRLEALEIRPDVAILDAHLSPTGGLDTAERIKRWYPQVEILLLTEFAEPSLVMEGLGRGVKGFLLKHRDARELVDATRLLARGTTTIDADLVDAIVTELSRSGEPTDRRLTQRELQVLQMVAEGRTSQDIGGALSVSEGSVKADLERIIKKLDASSRTSAVAEAFRRRLIE